jgi:hypothetical protein
MYGELPTLETATGQSVPAIPIVIPNPRKSAGLRLPTSEEITAYMNTVRTLVRQMGRGKSESEVKPNQEAERKLFDAIRLDKSGEAFDEYEVSKAIETVLWLKIEPYERDADQYVVKIVTYWGTTVHRCRIPLTREIQAYRENVYKSREMRHGMEERRFPPEVSSALYDAIIVSVEGYAPQFNVPPASSNGASSHVIEGEELKAFLRQIPPHHKRYVAGEISTALYDLDDRLLDPNS